MAERVKIGVAGTDPLAHPAVMAWSRLRPARVEPVGIDLLKEEARKSVVYRLQGVGQGGGAVVAKCSRRAKALTERTVYEEILPALSVPALHYYGFAEDTDGDFCWLFMEDAGDEPYSPKRAEHRALAGQWLGVLHAATIGSEVASRLHDRGPDHYLRRLQSAREAIMRNIANPALGAGDQAVLRAIVRQCDSLESRWGHVERLCEPMPRSFVHADFAVKNVRVRTGRDGSVFLPFDWGTAGWGIGAADLAQAAAQSVSPDLAAYWSVLRQSWPALAVEDIRRFADFGKVFRLLASIHWRTWDLAYNYQYEHEYPWLAACMSDMGRYRTRLAEAIRVVGLADRHAGGR